MYPVAVISPPTIFPIHCLTKSAQFSNLLSLVHWDFMAPISRLYHLIRAQCSDCWKDSRHFHDSFSFLHREAGEERMRNSMLFSTCFKAVRCFLHNQLSSRTHTTGLNLFFSATTIPRWWSAILMFETFFFLQPLKGRCNNFQGGIYYDSQPLPDRTLFTYFFTFIWWIVETHWSTKTCVETNDWCFSCFFSSKSSTTIS